ncbi:MAG: sulfite exporter TauE/SafE family protein [Piscinibacter sp.]|uniref:sulfite exporter TauE/SafE family protein n=1 Tax=Piscinibacter sp. TaxID=1903157 RepID=UPI00259057C1|nr:sulfite exporter TauE/SafE family protein [Piscinibacter sp.]MCW5666913.1 sulfite exporter TauE/SafE family protein [Piscinibacter sp.]
MAVDAVTAVAGALVGVVVGLTGVGGGALMTPILLLVFGVAPHTAIGTDLLFAAATKVVGTAVHHNAGTVDWRIVRRLACGSLPAALATLAWMQWSGAGRISAGVLINAVAVALLITALGMLFKERLHAFGRHLRVDLPQRFKAVQPGLTVLTGAVLGVMVTLTSIGAGALGTVALVYLYPLRLTPAKLVGTDLAHAIPLALVAGLGHLLLGNVDFALLGNLMLGSVPGVLLGSLLSTRLPQQRVQQAIAVVLGLVALKLLWVR